MNLKFIFVFFLASAIGVSSFAQSKKDILKNKVKSVTEIITVYENGRQITYNESFTLYNKDGKVVEETNYARDGSIQKKQTYTYDSEKNKTEETYYSKKETAGIVKGDVENTKTEIKYNANNEKKEEITYDETGNMLKKVKYSYNNRNLKTKRESYRSGDVLESTKFYTYEFY